MDFQEIKEILNQKLTEIWAYRRYTTPEEILCDNKAKKIHFIQKIESQAVFAEEEYTAWRRMFAAKHMERLRKTRLMKRCRNIELRIRLGTEIQRIKNRQKCIWKHIKEVFDEYCACREQIIEFKGWYHDLYDFNCHYYKEVIFKGIYFLLIFINFLFFSIIQQGLLNGKYFKKLCLVCTRQMKFIQISVINN